MSLDLCDKEMLDWPNEVPERLRIHSSVVSCTGNAFNEDVDSAVKQSKAVDVLRHPVRVDLLKTAVAAVCWLR